MSWQHLSFISNGVFYLALSQASCLRQTSQREACILEKKEKQSFHFLLSSAVRVRSCKTSLGHTPPTTKTGKNNLLQIVYQEQKNPLLPLLTTPTLPQNAQLGDYKFKIRFSHSVQTYLELSDFSFLNNAAHSLLSSEAQWNSGRPLCWYYFTEYSLLPQLLAGMLTFQISISLETLGYHYFITKSHMLKGVVGLSPFYVLLL